MTLNPLFCARQKLNVNPVSSALCTDVSASVGPSSAGTGSLGYIRLATFNGNTAGAFTQALKSLKVWVLKVDMLNAL